MFINKSCTSTFGFIIKLMINYSTLVPCRTERELVEAIVEYVCNKVQRVGYLADYKSNHQNLPTKLEDQWSCIWRSACHSFCCWAVCMVSVRVLENIYWSILASPNEIFFFVIVTCVVGYTDWLVTNQNYFKHKKLFF